MSTKYCPNCGAEVPSIANLCKHCFHDFNVPPPARKSPFWTLLLLAFGTSVVASLAYGYMHGAGQSSRVTLDEETESIIFTTTYADRTDAERVKYKDISTIELDNNASPMHYEISVVTRQGEHFVYTQSNGPLLVEANRLADTTGAPLVVKDDSPAGSLRANNNRTP